MGARAIPPTGLTYDINYFPVLCRDCLGTGVDPIPWSEIGMDGAKK